jgi:hypothetical protein
VHLVKVDLVHAEAPQRRVKRATEVAPGRAEFVAAIAHREAPLCGDHNLLAVPGVRRDPAPDDLLRGPFAVHVGRVDEIAARFDVVAKDGVRRRLVGLRAKGHGSQSERRDDGSAVPRVR